MVTIQELNILTTIIQRAGRTPVEDFAVATIMNKLYLLVANSTKEEEPNTEACKDVERI